MIELLWVLSGTVLGAAVMYGWSKLRAHNLGKLPASLVEVPAVEKILSMSSEVTAAFKRGGELGVVGVLLNKRIVYQGSVKDAKQVRRGLRLEGHDAHLIDEFGRDRG